MSPVSRTRIREVVRVLVMIAVALHVSGMRVHAQAMPPREAKQYFEAGATAYAMGDYRAAIQAFDAAYALTPLPAIAFSLAQAERREYFASREPAHLLRAIELFRAYLAAVSSGGRRADATDALAQLEPLALALQQSSVEQAERPPAAEAQRTRLLVRCEARGARIALDGGALVPSPLITETTPGPHRVRVEAPGYFPGDQQVTAALGELVPIEVVLRERPAVVIVGSDHGSDVYVDGELVPDAASRGRIELRAGRHQIAFAKKGHALDTRTVVLARGQTRQVRPQLKLTGQRVAAISLFAIGGGSLIAGLSLTSLALDREQVAQGLDARRKTENLTPDQRESYEDAKESRNRFRIAAIAGLTAAAGCLVTGLLLYQLDDPSPLEAAARARASEHEREAGLRVGLTAVPTGPNRSFGVRLGGAF